MTVLLFVLGLLLLLLGAELLVRGASRLAADFGIPPLVIGLTVVAFGTSAPELGVSISAALSGSADIALGNVVGSNIFNVLFILGVSALLRPLAVAQKLVRIEVPLMIGATLLLVALGTDGSISRLEGLVLVALGLAYTVLQIRSGRRQSDLEEDPAPKRSLTLQARSLSVVLVLLGLGMLVLGARWLVGGAIPLARALGVSELIIGLTVIAAGTSLPEVATSVIASLRGQQDIAVGNVVGSNIFNLLWVLGFTSVLSPSGVGVAASAMTFDVPVLLATSIVCLPIFFTGFVITRWEGGLLLAYYLVYAFLLILGAQSAPGLLTFELALLVFLAPLTLLTLWVLIPRFLAARRRSASRRTSWWSS